MNAAGLRAIAAPQCFEQLFVEYIVAFDALQEHSPIALSLGVKPGLRDMRRTPFACTLFNEAG
jgi:hypothetical protein